MTEDVKKGPGRPKKKIVKLKTIVKDSLVEEVKMSTNSCFVGRGFVYDENDPMIHRCRHAVLLGSNDIDRVKDWLKQNITNPHTTWHTEFVDGNRMEFSFNSVNTSVIKAFYDAFPASDKNIGEIL